MTNTSPRKIATSIFWVSVIVGMVFFTLSCQPNDKANETRPTATPTVFDSYTANVEDPPSSQVDSPSTTANGGIAWQMTAEEMLAAACNESKTKAEIEANAALDKVIASWKVTAEENYPEYAYLFDEYKDVNHEERAAFQVANPMIRAVNLAAYQFDAWSELENSFGQGIIARWALRPEFSQDNLARTEYDHLYPNVPMVEDWFRAKYALELEPPMSPNGHTPLPTPTSLPISNFVPGDRYCESIEWVRYQELEMYYAYLHEFAMAIALGSSAELDLEQEAEAPSECHGGCLVYPSWCAPPIKGNVAFDDGERIYHIPGQTYYEETIIDPDFGERWFCSEQEAQAAGWRRASN